MAQFDVYLNTDPRSARMLPYLLDIQSDLLSSLFTRLVVPLRQNAEVDLPGITRLHPKIDINGISCTALVSEMAAIPKSVLGRKFGSVPEARMDVVAACDLMITGN